jgi:hypothetical protein
VPWLPSHQDLRDHPKTRKAAVILGVPRAQIIGHLHCLWWWALSYAPDGDVSIYDDVDIAMAAEWEGDPAEFVRALIGCGSGGRPGFIDPDPMALHDWDDYGGKYVEKRRKDAARKAAARDGEPPDGVCPEDIRRTSEGHPTDGARRGEESREEEIVGASDKPKPTRRASSLPSGWTPNDKHREIARERGVDLDAEVEQFCDFHLAKGSTFKDWDASFRTWLRNSNKYQPRHLRPVGNTDADWANTYGNLSTGNLS